MNQNQADTLSRIAAILRTSSPYELDTGDLSDMAFKILELSPKIRDGYEYELLCLKQAGRIDSSFEQEFADRYGGE